MFCFTNEFGPLSFHKICVHKHLNKNKFCGLLGAVKEFPMTVPELSSMVKIKNNAAQPIMKK